MTPLHQNLQTSSGPWEWAFSRPGTYRRGPWSRLTYPTIRLFAEQTLKISVYFMLRIKSYSILTTRQTHILHPYMHRWDFFLYGFLYLSQHYVPLCASLTDWLTDFICEGLNFVNVTKIECELIFVLQLVRHPWRNCQWCRPERRSCCPSPQRRFCQTLVSESKSKCQKFFRSFISQ